MVDEGCAIRCHSGCAELLKKPRVLNSKVCASSEQLNNGLMHLESHLKGCSIPDVHAIGVNQDCEHRVVRSGSTSRMPRTQAANLKGTRGCAMMCPRVESDSLRMPLLITVVMASMCGSAQVPPLLSADSTKGMWMSPAVECGPARMPLKPVEAAKQLEERQLVRRCRTLWRIKCPDDDAQKDTQCASPSSPTSCVVSMCLCQVLMHLLVAKLIWWQSGGDLALVMVKMR